MVKIGKPIESLLGGATAVAAGPEEPEAKPTTIWRGANSGAERKEETAAEEELEVAVVELGVAEEELEVAKEELEVAASVARTALGKVAGGRSLEVT